MATKTAKHQGQLELPIFMDIIKIRDSNVQTDTRKSITCVDESSIRGASRTDLQIYQSMTTRYFQSLKNG